MTADLLEDPDGAPYPEEVQSFVRDHEPIESGEGYDWRGELVEALEAVAAAAWDDGSGAGVDYSRGAVEGLTNPHRAEDRGGSTLGRMVDALGLEKTP